MTLSAAVNVELTTLGRLRSDAESLVRAHPPRITNLNKQRIHAIACPPGSAHGSTHGGTIDASRWAAADLPETTPTPPVRATARAGLTTYDATYEADVVPWHVNFADAHLFFAYGGAAFAQDEMQVAEHPALASLRERILATKPDGFPALTTEDELPTPVLVMGVERRCAITTRLDGRSIYGNALQQASDALLARAVKRLEPPTITNVLAIEAPWGGRGKYTAETITRALRTAFTGFAAAKRESRRVRPNARTIIHSGHWGTGAYGGNRTLMAIVQIYAARLAQIDELVFFTFDDEGEGDFAEASRLFTTRLLETPNRPVGDVVLHLEKLGFAWGVSDGN